ncbi:MAG: hypothetical protein JRE14_11605, partial [Deltaproteobacteria bacterium]|nr:hypothetical protein [Deltaproteobacteria bacterium]
MNKEMTIKIFCMLAALFLMISCGGGGGGGDSSSDVVGVEGGDEGDDELRKNVPIKEIVPRDEDFRALEKKRFIPFSRQVEYLLIGTPYKGDTINNLFVIDPDINQDQDDLLGALYSPYFTDEYKKVAAHGMMDDDIQDEVAVVCWKETGAGTLVVIDPGGDPDQTTFKIVDTGIDLDL